MSRSVKNQFVHTVLVVAAVLLLALSIQGAMIVPHGSSAAQPSSHALFVSHDDAAAPVAIACNPNDPSQGGGGGC